MYIACSLQSLAERQREIDRLHRALSQAGSDEITSVARELDGLRQQTTTLSTQVQQSDFLSKF